MHTGHEFSKGPFKWAERNATDPFHGTRVVDRELYPARVVLRTRGMRTCGMRTEPSAAERAQERPEQNARGGECAKRGAAAQKATHVACPARGSP